MLSKILQALFFWTEKTEGQPKALCIMKITPKLLLFLIFKSKEIKINK